MKIIENQTFDKERAFYGSHELLIKNCSFDGVADGESAFKESSQIEAEHCFLIYDIHFGMIMELQFVIRK